MLQRTRNVDFVRCDAGESRPSKGDVGIERQLRHGRYRSWRVAAARLLAADGSVAPPSPMNRSSLSRFSVESASVERHRGSGVTRTPSRRREGTSGSTRCTRSPDTGSTVIVVPRASLLWNPSPRQTLRGFRVWRERNELTLPERPMTDYVVSA